MTPGTELHIERHHWMHPFKSGDQVIPDFYVRHCSRKAVCCLLCVWVPSRHNLLMGLRKYCHCRACFQEQRSDGQERQYQKEQQADPCSDRGWRLDC